MFNSFWLCGSKKKKKKKRKILKEMGIPEHLTGLLRNLYAGFKKQKLELDMEKQTDSKLWK